MDPDRRNGAWDEYRRLVLSELERIGRDLSSITQKIEDFRSEDLAEMRTDIALLKFQAALWGSVGGLIFGAIITLFLKFVLKWPA